MWTTSQQRAFDKALAACAQCEELIKRLEEIAKHTPAFADRIEQLRAMHDNLRQVAGAAIAVQATKPPAGK